MKHQILRKISRLILLTVIYSNSFAFASDEIQVTLKSDKNNYAPGETIYLTYEILWLGKTDGYLYFNNTSFPELEILYLNSYSLPLNEAGSISVRTSPGRHEKRGFAPTMSGESKPFPINAKAEPIAFLNGKKGYYVFDKAGTYVIRAKFSAKSPWKLYGTQSDNVYSNKIVINIDI